MKTQTLAQKTQIKDLYHGLHGFTKQIFFLSAQRYTALHLTLNPSHAVI